MRNGRPPNRPSKGFNESIVKSPAIMVNQSLVILCLHYTRYLLDSFSCRHEKLFAIVWTHLSDMWLSPLEIDTVQLRPVAEIVPKSPFLCVKRSPIREHSLQLWLDPDPSASQRWIPCSGPPTMSQDLSTRHDWPIKKSHCDLPIRLKRQIRNALPVIPWVRWEPRTRISALLARRYSPGFDYACVAG